MAAPITINTPIQFDDPLPHSVDVVIIGAGVIGIFSALYLARLGKRVLVCEKGRVAGEQSSRNWGWIRQHGRDEAELPIAKQALQLWHDIDTQTGGACGIKTVGISYLASSEQDLAMLHEWLDIAKRHGVESHALSQQQVRDQFTKSCHQQWLGGTCTPSDAKGEPWQAVPAVARVAHAEGVLIKENCAVRDLVMSSGKASGVVTEHGEVNCQQVVLCGGTWSSLFLRRLGIDLPQLSVEAMVAQTHAFDAGVQGSWVDEQLSMRRRDDGGYSLALADHHGYFISPDAFRHGLKFLPLLRKSWHDVQFAGLSRPDYPDAWGLQRDWQPREQTPFERQRVLEPPSHPKRVAMMRQRFAKRLPGVLPGDGMPTIKHSWSGMIDAMPDVVPVVDEVATISGFYLATGMSAHGFGIGPGYGRVIARMLAGLPAEHDLQRFRLSRFSDGTQLVVGPAL